MENKQRHGCLTAWLIFLIIASSVGSLSIFFNSESMSKNLPYIKSENMLLVLGSIEILNLMFAILLLKWVKLAFWGILSTSIVLCVIQIMGSKNYIYPIGTIIFASILYGLLKLKKNNISGWENLD